MAVLLLMAVCSLFDGKPDFCSLLSVNSRDAVSCFTRSLSRLPIILKCCSSDTGTTPNKSKILRRWILGHLFLLVHSGHVTYICHMVKTVYVLGTIYTEESERMLAHFTLGVSTSDGNLVFTPFNHY
eukprot:UN27321